MHERVVEVLACPVDGGRLVLHGRTLACAANHRFDLARQGYVNLAVGRDPGTGDGAVMVAAREEVFSRGHLDPLTEAVASVVAEHAPETGAVVDLGAGTGHHLAGVIERSADRVGLALDLSKHAARRAARRHPRVGAVVADVWGQLPVRAETAAAVLCVFAPRNAEEIVRVLRPGGVLVVATPAPDHLGELIEPLGLLAVDPRKTERLARTFDATMVGGDEVARVELGWQLSHEEVRTLVAMGPSADHLSAEQLDARVADLPQPVTVTGAVEVRTYRPR